MRKTPLEAWLRPPVELWSCLTSLGAGTLAFLAPWALMMPPGVAQGAGILLWGLAALRLRQAYRVWRYQRHLRCLPVWQVSTRDLPVSRHKLFLGRGFRWTRQHTQRLRDTLNPQARRYVENGPLYRWAREREIAWETHALLAPLARRLGVRAWWNPLAPQPPVGGWPAIHGVEPREQAVWMNLGDRGGHTLVLGTTRVGKTRLAEILITQDIRRGEVVIVFDPKGDADLMRRMYAEAQRSERAEDFCLFHLGFPQFSARYNAIGNFARITEVATRIASQLPGEGNSAAFREFAWRFVNIIAQALVALGRRPDFRQVRRYINDIEPLFIEYTRHGLARYGPPDWTEAVDRLREKIAERHLPTAQRGRQRDTIALLRYLQGQDFYDPVLDGLLSAIQYERTYFDKIVSSVGPLMEKLTTGAVAGLISPNYDNEEDPRPVFEWMDIIRRRGIVYIGLDALADTAVAGAVGNAMFADLVSVAGWIYKHGLKDGERAPPPTISLHADEFSELLGDEFVPLLNKAGGAGFQITAYTQTWSDVEATIGNRAKAGQVAGNFNTLIMLRVREPATAALLTDQLPQVEVVTMMSVSGVADTAEPGSGIDFRSRNEDRLSVTEVPMLTPADLVALPKGQAFVLMEGGQLWKIRIPLPMADPSAPATLPAIAAEMQRRCQTHPGCPPVTPRGRIDPTEYAEPEFRDEGGG